MTYMKALAVAEDGFYPLGANGMWHGGIHFDQNTSVQLKQGDGIRAIADGEVVAYRLDSKYPEQDYQDGRHALFDRFRVGPPSVATAASAAAETGSNQGFGCAAGDVGQDASDARHLQRRHPARANRHQAKR
jgi:hypothetical protein